jgi:Flp pilus assembly pilin Flp
MAEKTPQFPSHQDADTRADYALIAAASGVALVALIYLILT